MSSMAVLVLMFGSLTLFMLTGLPIAFVLGGLSLLFTVTMWNESAVVVLVLQIFDTMKSEALLAIPLYILMACILQRSGVIEALYRAMELWFGRLRGGLAVGTVVICVIMAAMTGVVGAAVTAMGILALPEMLRRGYDQKLALGTICASGTLGIATPTESAAVGVAGAMLAAGLSRRLGLGMLRGAGIDALKVTSMILWITIGAKAYVAIFTGLGGADALLTFIKELQVDRWVVLLAMMAILVFLGTVLDEIGIILLTVPVFLPVVRLLGFDEIWFGVLYAITIQMGYISPPFGYTLFYIKGTLPPHIGMDQVYRGVAPFFLLQLAGLIICAAFPDVITALPRMMREN